MKNKSLLLIGSLFLLSACSGGYHRTPPNNFSVEAGLQAYYDSFMANAKLYSANVDTSNLSIAFVDMGSTTVLGQCAVSTYSAKNSDGSSTSWDVKSVQIDPTYWATATEIDRFTIFYHEMGHCGLGLSHVNTYQTFPDGNYNATTIMNMYDISGNSITAAQVIFYWNYYMNNLFTGASNFTNLIVANPPTLSTSTSSSAISKAAKVEASKDSGLSEVTLVRVVQYD